MEIASIKGDTVLLLYHPAETSALVGEQFTILELPNKTDGLVAQVISNDSLEYVGLQQEMIQRILEQRVQQMAMPLNREGGMAEIKSIKVATAKIRKRIVGNQWQSWDGWIPTRNVEITRITASGLLGRVPPQPVHGISSFMTLNGNSIALDGPQLNMVNVIAGVKGSGKSHLAKHLALALSQASVPCIIFDINGEYTGLPNAQVLKWGDTFLPDLAEVGPRMLYQVVEAMYPLAETSAASFDAQLPTVFARRRAQCAANRKPFTIDVEHLKTLDWGTGRGGTFVNDAIQERLRVVGDMRLFKVTTTPPTVGSSMQASKQVATSVQSLYNDACNGKPIAFDMRELSPKLQHALVMAINHSIELICEEESKPNNGKRRYPFVFFEEAHFYINESVILNIITRGRHIGMASVFVTNTPQNLPDTVFRQLDNLFLLGLTHRDDIRNVSKNSFTDEETIQSFATRMPRYHALVVGNVTDRYPLVVAVDPLPSNVPPSGRTRSTWDRFPNAAPAQTVSVTASANSSKSSGTQP